MSEIFFFSLVLNDQEHHLPTANGFLDCLGFFGGGLVVCFKPV